EGAVVPGQGGPPLAGGGAADQVAAAVAVDVAGQDVAPAGELVPGVGEEEAEAVADVLPQPPLATGGAGNQVGPRRQLAHEGVGVAGAGEVGGAGSGVEVGRAEEVAGGVGAARGVRPDAVADVAAGAAEGLGPEEVAGGVQFAHEGVVVAGAGEILGAGSGVEVGRALEGAGGQDGARPVHRDAKADLAPGAAQRLGPEEVAGRVQLA